VPVQIKGIDHVYNALNDSRSDINLIRRSLVQQLIQLLSRGRVKIKGIVGPAVETAIVLLDVSPAATETNWVTVAPPLGELFAECDDLNEPIISTADTVHRLSTSKSYESVVIPEPAETVVNQMCENDETVAHNETVMEKHYEVDSQSADTITLINEQKADPALVKYFDMVRHGHKQFFIRDNLLYRRGKVNGNPVEQLCLPQGRIETVLKLAHDMPTSCHQAVRRTNDRIATSFYFPGQWQRVKTYCDSCNVCQMRTRERRTDLVPIRPIDHH
jgi:Integrase zinc binding domain